jgi:hypothetical protein
MCLQLDPISQDTYIFHLQFYIHEPFSFSDQIGIREKVFEGFIFLQVFCFLILTRLKLTRGEGQLGERISQLSRRRTIQSPQVSRRHSPSMAHEESHEIPTSKEETFRKYFYDMT